MLYICIAIIKLYCKWLNQLFAYMCAVNQLGTSYSELESSLKLRYKHFNEYEPYRLRVLLSQFFFPRSESRLTLRTIGPRDLQSDRIMDLYTKEFKIIQEWLRRRSTASVAKCVLCEERMTNSISLFLNCSLRIKLFEGKKSCLN